jgi:BirA family biotin operon repressor/biotin-[acetyl-CoA-carboxylase] ligase
VAVQQTHGRGRLGRSWESLPGASLTFSLSLAIQRPDWSGLSLAVGLAVATALDPAGTQLGLKWPNDLWRLDAPGQGRKLGGILIEGMQVTDQRMAVIGIGLNILPLTMPEQVASLSEFLPGLDAPQVLARVMPELARVLARFEREGFGGLAQAYAARDLLRGHR